MKDGCVRNMCNHIIVSKVTDHTLKVGCVIKRLKVVRSMVEVFAIAEPINNFIYLVFSHLIHLSM